MNYNCEARFTNIQLQCVSGRLQPLSDVLRLGALKNVSHHLAKLLAESKVGVWCVASASCIISVSDWWILNDMGVLRCLQVVKVGDDTWQTASPSSL